jgi:hypothetical protein
VHIGVYPINGVTAVDGSSTPSSDNIANTYAKIGVRNRAEATAYILHIGAET